MLDEGVESCSDGVHQFHWKLINYDGKVDFSICERLRKSPHMLDEWVESRSDGVYQIRWKRIDSNGKGQFLFDELKSKCHGLP